MTAAARWSYSWFLEPASFFEETFQALREGTRAMRIIACILTLAIPAFASVNLAIFLSRSALALIITRFVPTSVAGYVYFALSLLITALASTCYARLSTRKDVAREEENNSQGTLSFSRILNATRMNLCFLPSLVLSLPLALHARPYAWNAFQFGTFLTVVFWTHLFWTVWMLGASTMAMPAILGQPGSVDRTLVKAGTRRILIGMLLAWLATSLAGSLLLAYVMGMERLPLLFKIAYFLLHGN